MKTMTCRQLGGACDEVFSANTFEQMAELSRQHGALMFERQDAEHLSAMQTMQSLMQDPDAMQLWFTARKQEFDALADDV